KITGFPGITGCYPTAVAVNSCQSTIQSCALFRLTAHFGRWYTSTACRGGTGVAQTGGAKQRGGCWQNQKGKSLSGKPQKENEADARKGGTTECPFKAPSGVD